MQNYKISTLSSYEYDALTQSFKKVDKEVQLEDTSFDFLEALNSAQGDEEFQSELSQSKLSKTNGTMAVSSSTENQESQSEFDSQSQSSRSSNSNQSFESPYASMSNIYAYRFRQNADEFSLKAQQPIQKESMLSELLSAI
ncbi:MAG: hypothetical protein J1D99_04790 [Campylobacter sp.]|nr:hypothetical protein [Campylobacter sp.]